MPYFRQLHRVLPCFCIAASVLILGACVSSRPAPVETRDATSRAQGPQGSSTSASSAASTPSAAARPGYYTVKKGDTLYSISLENGHDYRDVASWNGITNPGLIAVGQELRVQPPDSTSAPVSGTRPVILPRIESRPIDQSAPMPSQSGGMVVVPVPVPNASGIVTEPRGGRIPYSEKTWKDLQAQAQMQLSAPLLAQSEPKAASAPGAEKPVPVKPAVPVVPTVPAATSAPVALPDAAVKSEEGVEWSWPSNGRLIATFNDSSNKGIDIAGPMGDPVFAAATGKVIYSGSDLRAYGNLVIIKHGANFTTVYAHNKEILVKEGQSVQKGQKIAVMGDSDAERPKLHFEIRRQGKPADPLKFLPTR